MAQPDKHLPTQLDRDLVELKLLEIAILQLAENRLQFYNYCRRQINIAHL
jgi:hypothetical protein